MATNATVITLQADVNRFTADMKRAGDSVDSAMGGMQRSAAAAQAAMAGMAMGVASALSVGSFVSATKGVADYADEMGKMSQRVGVAVEQLSGLTYAAGLSDVSNEALGTGLKKLSKLMQEAAGGMEQPKRILKELGVNETQDAGKAFLQLADRFSTMEEGAGKTAAAMAVFGKSGADLLPLMNSGAEGIRAATDEAARFGLVVGKDAADAAEKFNDNLTRLAALTKGAQVSIFGDLVIGIGNATQAYLDAAKEGNKFIGIINAIQTLLTGDDRHKNNVALVEDTDKLLAAENALSAARASGMNPIGIAARQKFVDDLKERIKLTLGYKKILDEQDTQAAAPAKTGKVNAAIFGTNPTGGKPAQTDAQKLEADAQRFVAKLREQAEAYGKTGAALLEYQLAQGKMPQQYKDEAMALQLRIDALKAGDDANKAAIKADIEGFKTMDDLRKADAIAVQKNEDNVQAIRVGLMSEADQQAYAHEQVLAELQVFHDAKFENVALANALIEEENARHSQALADMQASRDMQSLAMAGNSADDLYRLMEAAGMEQSALGKALFFANKALAVAEIIMNTNLAASKVEGQTGLFGLPMAAFVMAQGYTRAAMVAGLAISGAREKGGPVWAGGAFVVGEKGPEIFKPSGHGNIIPNSALGAGGDFKLTLVTNGTPQRVVDSQRISDSEYSMILEDASNMAVQKTISSITDSNGRTGRAIRDSFGLQRRRL